MLYMVTFTINIPPMLAYKPYMDPMGYTTLQNIENYNDLGKNLNNSSTLGNHPMYYFREKPSETNLDLILW